MSRPNPLLLALLPALSLACAHEPEALDPEPDAQAISRAGGASFGGQITNLRVRQSASGGAYRVDVEMTGDAAEILDEVAEVALSWGDDGETTHLPHEAWHVVRLSHDTGASDPTGGTYAVSIALTGLSGDETLTETAAATVTAGGDTVAVQTLSAGTVWIRATGALDVGGTGDDHDLLITATLRAPADSAAATADWAAVGTVAPADRVSPASTNPTDRGDLDDVRVIFTADVGFAGDPAGTAWDLDADAYDDSGRRKAQGDFAIEFVQIADEEGAPGPLLAVSANGKGTRNPGANTAGSAELL